MNTVDTKLALIMLRTNDVRDAAAVLDKAFESLGPADRKLAEAALEMIMSELKRLKIKEES